VLHQPRATPQHLGQPGRALRSSIVGTAAGVVGCIGHCELAAPKPQPQQRRYGKPATGRGPTLAVSTTMIPKRPRPAGDGIIMAPFASPKHDTTVGIADAAAA
jgi:hypothetical protein